MTDSAPAAELRIRPDRLTCTLLCVLTFLLAVIAVELWAGLSDARSSARAQIPDTGLQRQQLVVEARRTSDLLEQILDHLRHGSVKVTMEVSDKSRATPPPAGRR